MTECDGYRSQEWATRVGKPLCADKLANVFSGRLDEGATEPTAIKQLAADLSGRYGLFRVRFSGQHDHGTLTLNGIIYDDVGTEAGQIIRRFFRDPETSGIVAKHDLQSLHDWARGREFGSTFWREVKPYYARSEVERIELYADLENGGLAWARAGYDWDRDESRLERSLQNVRAVAERMEADSHTGPDDELLLRAAIDSLHPGILDLPTPLQLAMLSTPKWPNLGEILMRQAHWYGVMYL